MQNLLNASNKNIKKAAQILKQGGVIGYPTETVYGLGGIISNANTLSRIIQLKQRDYNHPMLLLVPDELSVSSIVCEVSETAHQLMHRFWPGPLTLVFKAKKELPDSLTGIDGGIGLRISPDPICQMLLIYVKDPIISTSANPAGMAPAQSATEVYRYFGLRLDAILDDGIRNRNVPSTVLDIRSRPVKLLRKGAVSSHEIRKVIGDLLDEEIL